MISQNVNIDRKKWYDIILEEYQKQQDNTKLKDIEAHQEDALPLQNEE